MEDGGWKIEDRVIALKAILDPRSSILNPRPPRAVVKALDVLST
jgi:hypothetical protein